MVVVFFTLFKEPRSSEVLLQVVVSQQLLRDPSVSPTETCILGWILKVCFLGLQESCWFVLTCTS